MRRKICIFLGLIGILGFVCCGVGHAATVTVNLQSTAGIDVYGPSTTDFVGEVPQNVTAGSASELSPVPAAWPSATSNPDLLGSAVWITNPTAPPNETDTNYSLFQDSFTPPCTASGVEGILNTAANNSETVYLNGTAISTGNSGSVVSIPLNPVQGENTLGFDVETDGVTASNPVGLIYNATFTYSVPDVIWRPPIVGTGRTMLKNGSNLPIKFVLKTDSGVLHTVQDIYVSISGPDGEVASFAPGQGMKFARGNGQYHANFHSKNYTLQTGVQYTVSVNDACSNAVLGTISIQFKDRGNGKLGKKNGRFRF